MKINSKIQTQKSICLSLEFENKNTHIVLTTILQGILDQCFGHFFRIVQIFYQIHCLLVLAYVPEPITCDYKELSIVLHIEAFHIWNIGNPFCFEGQVTKGSCNGQLSCYSTFEYESTLFLDSFLFLDTSCFVID